MRYALSVFSACLLLASAPLLLSAEQNQPTAPSAQDYVLGPGDVLVIEVFGEKELSGKFPVGPSGNIVLPQIGMVKVAGLTLAEAQETIRKALSELLRRPVVGVSIDELASVRKIYVGGRVEQPGPREMPFGSTVLDAIIAAGIRPDSDLRQVHLTRPGSPPQVLDLSGWRTAQGVALGALLRYGDIIFVPELTDRISVLGAVNKPLTLVPAIGERISLLEAVAQAAGGLAPDADPTNARVLHSDGSATKADLQKLIEEGDISQNVELKPGDVVVVPKAKSISVVGRVASPASFVSGEPVPVLQALAKAGAVDPDADLKHARIIRASGTEEVDLEAMIKHGERAGEITLLPGDVLVIPQAKAEEVLIAGAVERPGPVNIRGVENRDILRLLTLAGLTTAADKTRICVFRGEQQIVINYKQLLEEGQLEKNIQLEPGDLVYVPSLDRVYVLGAVSSGGRAIPCPKEGIKLLDALVEAGGMSPTANPDDIHVVRPRPDGVTEHVEIQLGQVKKGKAPPALVLKPGDIVYVGSLKGPRFTWYSIREMLWSLGALRALF